MMKYDRMEVMDIIRATNIYLCQGLGFLSVQMEAASSHKKNN